MLFLVVNLRILILPPSGEFHYIEAPERSFYKQLARLSDCQKRYKIHSFVALVYRLERKQVFLPHILFFYKKLFYKKATLNIGKKT